MLQTKKSANTYISYGCTVCELQCQHSKTVTNVLFNYTCIISSKTFQTLSQARLIHIRHRLIYGNAVISFPHHSYATKEIPFLLSFQMSIFRSTGSWCLRCNYSIFLRVQQSCLSIRLQCYFL